MAVQLQVTLYARVWIEIVSAPILSIIALVTLYARVWIEIRETLEMVNKARSHPLREGVD